MKKKKFERSIDVVPKDILENLSASDREIFEINDAIFDLHELFMKRVASAKDLPTLSGIVLEYTGRQHDMRDGKFSELLNRILKVEYLPAANILAEVFNTQQDISLTLFEKKVKELENPNKTVIN